MGDAPWIDSQPRPNWLSLGITTGVLLVGGVLLYGFLLIQLVETLST